MALPTTAPAASLPRAAPSAATAERRITINPGRIALLTATIILVAVNFAGAEYYRMPMGERVRADQHAWLRPGGYVGQTAGIVAALLFAFLWLYPLRKKLRAFAWLGAIGKWLDVHIAVALLMPLLLAIHSAWRVGGIVGLGVQAMMIVWASGIVGRYLYTRIPRSRSGLELTLDEIAATRRTLVTDLAATTGLDPVAIEKALSAPVERRESHGTVRILIAMLLADITRWRMARELRRQWKHLPGRHALDADALEKAIDLATREIALEQQVRFLQRTHRIFRYWHLLHRPLAFTALVAVVIHITVVVAVGATWFR